MAILFIEAIILSQPKPQTGKNNKEYNDKYKKRRYHP